MCFAFTQLVKTLLALLLDLLSSTFIYFTALFIVIFDVSSTNTGLALSNALQLLLFVQWLIRMGGDVHSSMSSVTALKKFADHVPSENNRSPTALTTVSAPDGWPKDGKVSN